MRSLSVPMLAAVAVFFVAGTVAFGSCRLWASGHRLAAASIATVWVAAIALTGRSR